MLSDFQKKKIGMWFQFQDANGDGLLKQEDYEQFADQLIAQRGTALESPEGQHLRSIFMGYWQAIRQMGGDTNQVTRDQFMAGHDFMLGNPATYDATIDALTDSLVDVLDTDKDGNCTLDEVSSFYLPLGVPDIRQKIEQVDMNHDGYISRMEFRQLVREFYGDDPAAPGSRLLGEIN